MPRGLILCSGTCGMYECCLWYALPVATWEARSPLAGEVELCVNCSTLQWVSLQRVEINGAILSRVWSEIVFCLEGIVLAQFCPHDMHAMWMRSHSLTCMQQQVWTGRVISLHIPPPVCVGCRAPDLAVAQSGVLVLRMYSVSQPEASGQCRKLYTGTVSHNCAAVWVSQAWFTT